MKMMPENMEYQKVRQSSYTINMLHLMGEQNSYRFVKKTLNCFGLKETFLSIQKAITKTMQEFLNIMLQRLSKKIKHISHIKIQDMLKDVLKNSKQNRIKWELFIVINGHC